MACEPAVPIEPCVRAEGEVVGKRWVQVVPSHSQVSASRALGVSEVPPKRTSLPWTSVMTWP
jgi:hypothetical protein